MTSIRMIGCAALLGVCAIARTSAQDHDDFRGEGTVGAVFAMDNAASENHVMVYRRGSDGRLTPNGSFATGGRGTGAGLGSQGSLILSSNGRWLFACNAGSDELSVFRINGANLILTDRVPSQGHRPISLTLHGNLLFALNAGGLVGDTDNVAGFAFAGGKLQPLAQSVHPLSAAKTNPAEVSFSSDGNVLIVTEKDTGVSTLSRSTPMA